MAIVLGHQEVAAIRRGESPGSGEGLALLARNVGWFHLVMLVIVVLGLTLRK